MAENMITAGKAGLTFGGDWNEAVEYERLVGVRYDNKLFFSKKPVPVGTIPEDGEFWFLAYEGLTDAEWEAVLDGTQQVGNSAKLGGKDAIEWQAGIDNIQTTSKAELKTAGWYRVAEYVRFDTNDPANGSRGNSCILAIKRSYISTNNESHIILYSVTYNKMNIKPLMSQVNSPAITKTRITAEGNKSYLEVYYSLNTSNTVSFTVMMPQDYSYNWSAITPTLTEEIVDGVTVYDTCELSANISPTTTSDLANYLPLSGGKVSGYLTAGAGATIKRNASEVLSLGNTNGTTVLQSYYGNGELLGFIGISNGVPCFIDATNSNKTILHTGNKPTGTYTGNGSATKREIQIGGIGEILAIQEQSYILTFVGKFGAVCFAEDGNSYSLSKDKIKFENGVLTIVTDSPAVNYANATYKYGLLC